MEPDHKSRSIKVNPYKINLYLPEAIEDIFVENIKLFNKRCSVFIGKRLSEIMLADWCIYFDIYMISISKFSMRNKGVVIKYSMPKDMQCLRVCNVLFIIKNKIIPVV
ncbi:MAG TPA: hypothetical protein HA306_02300 [Methanosarcina sp.]|nr:hypothetical protein [Methanosarcina sp.]